MRADSIEVDVRQTGDGHLVACHDFNLSRLTGKHQRLSEISLTEFQKLRINGLEPPATLEEILSCVGQNLDIILDVKEKCVSEILRLLSAFIHSPLVEIHNGKRPPSTRKYL